MAFCKKKYYLENREEIRRKQKEYWSKNKERLSLERKEKYKNNLDVHQGYRLKNIFGLSLEDYDELYFKQEGKCKVCGAQKSNRRSDNSGILVVDHCHKTGKIRGLLCNNCNTALGLLRESKENAMNLIEYIKSFEETQ